MKFIVLLFLFFSYQSVFAGVKIDIIKEGDGLHYPKKSQTVTVHYVGKLENGKKFDSSRSRGSPFSFVLGEGNVIRGLEEAIPKMSIGELARLTITPDYAYGKEGVNTIIPSNATLIFEVELLNIE